jgi:hypothetical protein
MAQPLQSINLVAPAFKGINTEDSPIAQDPSFADVADNAVIDKRGRIAARKGLETLTNNKVELGTDYVHTIHEFFSEAGNTVVFSMGNNKILSGVHNFVNETPSGYTITGNDWRTVNFNNAAYFFQRGHEPLIYTDAGGLQTFGDYEGHTTPTTLYCNEAAAAYGRIWAVDSDEGSQIIYWSDLLIGTDFSSGSSGSINISEAWPDGADSVVGIAAHNSLLIIFGKRSIIVYEGADSPAAMVISDTVPGVGCIDRNSIQHIGTDILFLDDTGLRSFGRTIQEKSMPINDLSGNIKTEFIETLVNRQGPVATIYSPENTFYLVSFPSDSLTYCFDLKGKTENGSYRVTRWPGSSFYSFETITSGDLIVGNNEGLSIYSGYSDNGEAYRFKYYSPGLTFGDPSKLKILKKLRPTIVGADSATVFIYWAYDFSTAFRSQAYVIGSQQPSFFSNPIDPTTGAPLAGLSEFSDPRDPVTGALLAGLSEFTGGTLISRRPINATGNGSVITIGLEAFINGFPLSLQEINVLALMGKTL